MKEFPPESVHRFAHEAMGTIFEVLIAGQEAGYAAQAAEAVFREIDRLEGLFSRFNATSEIGQINRLRADESLRIRPGFFRMPRHRRANPARDGRRFRHQFPAGEAGLRSGRTSSWTHPDRVSASGSGRVSWAACRPISTSTSEPSARAMRWTRPRPSSRIGASSASSSTGARARPWQRVTHPA